MKILIALAAIVLGDTGLYLGNTYGVAGTPVMVGAFWVAYRQSISRGAHSNQTSRDGYDRG